MGKMFNEIINLRAISLEILKRDIKQVLIQQQKLSVTLPNYLEKAFEDFLKSNDLDAIVEELGKLFYQLAIDKKYDLAIMVQQFLQRAAYFATTSKDYENYTKTFKATLMNQHSAGEIFQAIFVPFFDEQINFYYHDFLTKIDLYNVKDWNVEFYNDLKSNLKNELKKQDFIFKIENLERLIYKLSDVNQLYRDLNLDFEAKDANKEAFLTQLNEFRIVLQTMDVLIQQVILKINEVINNEQ